MPCGDTGLQLGSYGSHAVFFSIWNGSCTTSGDRAEILENNDGGRTARTGMGLSKNGTVGIIGREEDESFVSDPVVSEKDS